MTKTPHIITPWELAESGTEHGHQAALFLWAATAMRLGFVEAKNPFNYRVGMLINKPIVVSELKWLHAIPNGGGRSIVTATMLKAEGVKRGVSDVFLPWPIMPRTMVHCRHGLYIEMKRPKNAAKKIAKGTSTVEQDEFRIDMRAVGYCCAVCYTWIEAADTIEAYLAGKVV